ncbi:site-specific integrase [Desulfovibrio aminophilus]|jgi:integrase|nr:site-specific integrase [Desulfovibrio aminophilus]MCM0755090.1 site-specific integrase [Desulfovibrio aminophilus]
MGTKYHLVDAGRWPGVYCYASSERRYQGKADVCYVVAYRLDKKLRWEKVGWKSEGYTPPIAGEIRAERMKQIRHGEEVKTSKEIQREQRQKNREIDEIAAAYFDARRGERWRRIDEKRYMKHIAPLLGKKTVKTLSPLDVARVKQSMKGLAPSTIWGALEILRRVLNHGAKIGMCPSLKFSIEMPKKDNEVVEYLTAEEVSRFLQVLEDWPNQDAARMLKLALFSGMRRGEIFKLQVADVDFRLGLITLRGPKGGKTVSIPLNPIVRKILTDQIHWKSARWPGSDYVFPGKGGAQRTDSNAVDRIKSAANLPKRFRIFHGLRHHYAVTLANSGKFSLDVIGELLTHKSIAMTKRYGQFLPDTMKRAGELAAEVVMKGIGGDGADIVALNVYAKSE